jgi:hypothetical protein
MLALPWQTAGLTVMRSFQFSINPIPTASAYAFRIVRFPIIPGSRLLDGEPGRQSS